MLLRIANRQSSSAGVSVTSGNDGFTSEAMATTIGPDHSMRTSWKSVTTVGAADAFTWGTITSSFSFYLDPA
jgi:hypothetical protein